MYTHSINEAIAAAMKESWPSNKDPLDQSYLDSESNAVRFIHWAIARLTPEQAIKLVDLAAISETNPIQNSLLLLFPEILDDATRRTVAHDEHKARNKQRR